MRDDRFHSKIAVAPDTGCWLWTAARVPLGYGAYWLNGTMRKAHRVSYELHVGPIPEGLELDHLCRNQSCVNPAHLEPVTHAENMRRWPHPRKQASTCAYGHPYDESTPVNNKGRVCRTCATRRNREYRERVGLETIRARDRARKAARSARVEASA